MHGNMQSMRCTSSSRTCSLLILRSTFLCKQLHSLSLPLFLSPFLSIPPPLSHSLYLSTSPPFSLSHPPSLYLSLPLSTGDLPPRCHDDRGWRTGRESMCVYVCVWEHQSGCPLTHALNSATYFWVLQMFGAQWSSWINKKWDPSSESCTLCHIDAKNQTDHLMRAGALFGRTIGQYNNNIITI